MRHTALAATLLLLATPAGAATVDQAWSRATAGPEMPAAIFATLHGGTGPDELVSVTTPIAPKAELHSMDMGGGMMRMKAIPALPVPAGATVTLGPEGDHVMLTGLTAGLARGQTFPATFRFQHAGPVTVTVHVAGPGASGP